MKFLSKLAIQFGYAPKASASTLDHSISYYDWGKTTNAEEEWFTSFIRKNIPTLNVKLNFYGVYGKGKFVHRAIEGRKIFFSMENLDRKFTGWNWKFGDYALPYVDLAMGFSEIDNAKYLRFPLWIKYVFSPLADKQEIVETVNRINTIHYPKTKECALIAGHDKHGTRSMVYEGLKDLLTIECAGRWNNNTTELWNIYKDNKLDYLRKFKFNICPENVNTNLYVTEKLFEAFLSDAIPIYYGSDNQPELGIINPATVIFWNQKGDNAKARDLIIKLKTDELFYQDFIAQPKLLPGAADYVYDRYKKLESKIKNLLV